MNNRNALGQLSTCNNVIIIKRRLIDDYWLCPYFDKAKKTSERGCGCKYFKFNQLKTHVVKCYKEEGIEVPKTLIQQEKGSVKRSRNFNQQKESVKKRKIDEITPILKDKNIDIFDQKNFQSFIQQLEKTTDFTYNEDEYITQLKNEIYQLKIENESIRSKHDEFNSKYDELIENINNCELPPFSDIKNHIKHALQESDNNDGRNIDKKVEFILELISQNPAFKMKNSTLIGYSSKNKSFDYFVKTGVTLSRNYLYNPCNIQIIDKLVKKRNDHLRTKKILLVHFDNNDVGTKYHQVMKYWNTTSICVYILVIPIGLIISRVGLNDINLSLNKSAKIVQFAREIFYFSSQESLMYNNELTQILLKIELDNKKEILDFGIPAKRVNSTIDLFADDFNNDKVIEEKLVENIENEKMVQIESTDLGCHNQGDFEKNDEVIQKIFPGIKLIYCGDQPVYEYLRRVMLAIPGKFHIKLNCLKGLFSSTYAKLIHFIQKKYFKQKQNLEEIPQGFFKISEKLFLNFYILSWSLLHELYKTFKEEMSIKLPTLNLQTITIFNFFNMLKYPIVQYHLKYDDLYSYNFVYSLYEFCTRFGLAIYLLIKSIKKNDYYLYVLSNNYTSIILNTQT